MNRLLLLLVTGFSAFAIVSATSIKQSKYFEGKIHYRVNYVSLNPKLSEDFLIQQYGDTLIGYFQEDKYAFYQNSKSEWGSLSMIYLLEEGSIYWDYEKHDTIYKYNLLDKEGELIDFQLNNEDSLEIIGHNCKSISMTYHASPKTPYFTTIESKHYFSKDLGLNPEKYKKHNRSYWNKYVDTAKGINLRSEITNNPHFKVIYEAWNIDEKPISNQIFTINQAKFIKTMN